MKSLLNQNRNLVKIVKTSVLLLSLILFSTNFSNSSNKTNNKTYRIAITQIVDHPGLNLSSKGILEALADKGFIKDKNLIVDEFSAQGQQVINMQIAQKIMSNNDYDLAIGVSTPSIQALINARKDGNFPLIFSSVTDAKILGIEQGSKITGAIDAPPLDEVWQAIKQLSRKIKNIGVIYNSGEANSVELLKELNNNTYGFKIVTKAINNTNQIKQAVQAIVDDIDLMLVIPDNTVVAGIDVLFKTIKQAKPSLLTFVVDSALLEKGALIAVGFEQFDVGYVAGTQAAAILNGKDINSLPIKAPGEIEILVNKTLADEMGIKIPKEILFKAKIIEVVK